MISVARSAGPRRRPNRVALVNIDGTPVRRPTRDFALSWPAWTDNHYHEIGESPHDLAAPVHVEPIDPEDDRRDGPALWAEMMIEASLPPVETDAQFLARLDAQDAAERERIETTYFPTRQDLAS